MNFIDQCRPGVFLYTMDTESRRMTSRSFRILARSVIYAPLPAFPFLAPTAFDTLSGHPPKALVTCVQNSDIARQGQSLQYLSTHTLAYNKIVEEEQTRYLDMPYPNGSSTDPHLHILPMLWRQCSSWCSLLQRPTTVHWELQNGGASPPLPPSSHAQARLFLSSSTCGRYSVMRAACPGKETG